MTREQQAAADAFAATLRPLARSVAARTAPARLREDVAAACWLAVLVAARATDLTRLVAPYRWARRVMHDAAVNWLLAEVRSGRPDGREGRPAADPVTAVDAADWWAVRSARLDPRRARAVWLRLAEGRTVAEVAAELGVSVEPVCRLVAEGRAKLRGVA